MIGYIYKITNPAGNVYIGQTVNFDNRISNYRRKNTKSQPKLNNSLCKYGFESHIVEIIEEVDSIYLNDREIYWISYYDSYKNGMNCTMGGDKGFMFGEDNFAKRIDVRLKMSESKKNYYKNNVSVLKGKKHNEETINKIKQKRKEQAPIIYKYVLDLETGIYYYGIKELSVLLNIEYKTFYSQIKYTKKWLNKYIVC